MIHPRTSWRRRGVAAVAAATAYALLLAPSADALELAGDVAADATVDAALDVPADRGLDVAADVAADASLDARLRARLQAHRAFLRRAALDRPADRPVDTRPDTRPDTRSDTRPDTRPAPDTRPDPAPDTRPAPRPLPPEPQPSDRPDDRPDDRPEHDERHEVFPIGQIGKAHLAWTQRYVRVVEVKFAEGWKHRVHQESREKLAIHFTNGESCGTFVAGLRPDGLHTEVHRTDCPEPEVRTETFPVGDIAKVTLAWNRHGMRVQEVVTADGWRHRVHQEHRHALRVGFTDGEHCVLFSAKLTDAGEVRTHVERHRCATDRPTDERPTDEEPTDTRPTDEQPTDERPTDEKPDDGTTTDGDRTVDATTTSVRPVKANADAA